MDYLLFIGDNEIFFILSLISVLDNLLFSSHVYGIASDASLLQGTSLCPLLFFMFSYPLIIYKVHVQCI